MLMISKVRVSFISWYSSLTLAQVFTLDLDLWMASCNNNGVSRFSLLTDSWSASVEDKKSPREPESNNALAGRPFMFTFTTMGLGKILWFPFTWAAFRWRAGYC